MKRPLLAAMLYAALTLGANPSLAATMDSTTRQAILDMRVADMRKLNIPASPHTASNVAFLSPEGQPQTFADSNGKFRLVNFWATWCPPCRAEMPALDTLQSTLGSEDFTIMTIATGGSKRPDMKRFFDQANVENLPLLQDKTGQLARAMAVIGLPTTVLLDRDGNEIARVTGGAEWTKENVTQVLTAIMVASDAATE